MVAGGVVVVDGGGVVKALKSWALVQAAKSIQDGTSNFKLLLVFLKGSSSRSIGVA